MMNIKDFKPSEIFDFEGKIKLWGDKVGIGVKCHESTLEEMLPKINKLLEFLESGKDEVVRALVEDGMLETAEDWASSAEEAEESTEERECYIMDDGTKVYLPIAEEDFAKSLRFDSISVWYSKKNDDITADVFLVCRPDYFAGHCIELYVKGDLSIKVQGLAG